LYCARNKTLLGYKKQSAHCEEAIDVCSKIHTKHLNSVCGSNVEFFNVKLGGTYLTYKGLFAELNSNFATS